MRRISAAIMGTVNTDGAQGASGLRESPGNIRNAIPAALDQAMILGKLRVLEVAL